MLKLGVRRRERGAVRLRGLVRVQCVLVGVVGSTPQDGADDHADEQ